MNKVIKGLECCAAMSGNECRECPYEHECRDTDLPYGMSHLAADALALLKEQEAIKPLFKTNPVTGTEQYLCGNCQRRFLFELDRYCPHCGRAVKWDA